MTSISGINTNPINSGLIADLDIQLLDPQKDNQIPDHFSNDINDNTDVEIVFSPKLPSKREVTLFSAPMLTGAKSRHVIQNQDIQAKMNAEFNNLQSDLGVNCAMDVFFEIRKEKDGKTTPYIHLIHLYDEDDVGHVECHVFDVTNDHGIKRLLDKENLQSTSNKIMHFNQTLQQHAKPLYKLMRQAKPTDQAPTSHVSPYFGNVNHPEITDPTNPNFGVHIASTSSKAIGKSLQDKKPYKTFIAKKIKTMPRFVDETKILSTKENNFFNSALRGRVMRKSMLQELNWKKEQLKASLQEVDNKIEKLQPSLVSADDLQIKGLSRCQKQLQQKLQMTEEILGDFEKVSELSLGWTLMQMHRKWEMNHKEKSVCEWLKDPLLPMDEKKKLLHAVALQSANEFNELMAQHHRSTFLRRPKELSYAEKQVGFRVGSLLFYAADIEEDSLRLEHRRFIERYGVDKQVYSPAYESILKFAMHGENNADVQRITKEHLLQYISGCLNGRDQDQLYAEYIQRINQNINQKRGEITPQLVAANCFSFYKKRGAVELTCKFLDNMKELTTQNFGEYALSTMPPLSSLLGINQFNNNMHHPFLLNQSNDRLSASLESDIDILNDPKYDDIDAVNTKRDEHS